MSVILNMSPERYSGLLRDVASCYVHLLLTLPALDLYLQSLPSLLVGGSDSEEVPQLQRYHLNYYNMQSKRWLMIT